MHDAKYSWSDHINIMTVTSTVIFILKLVLIVKFQVIPTMMVMAIFTVKFLVI